MIFRIVPTAILLALGRVAAAAADPADLDPASHIVANAKELLDYPIEGVSLNTSPRDFEAILMGRGYRRVFPVDRPQPGHTTYLFVKGHAVAAGKNGAMPALLAVDSSGRIVPSKLADDLNAMGFQIITWTFERSDLRFGASRAGSYYDFDAQGVAIKKDSDMYKALDVLAKQVKVIGLFSDWPATVSYYASCMNLK